MVPSGVQQKEKNTMIKEIERGRQQVELLKAGRNSNLIQLLQQRQVGGSNGTQLGAFTTLVYESEKLTKVKQRKISMPESHEKLGQNLPNHKVWKCLYVSAFCVHCHLFHCFRFWLIISCTGTLRLRG